MRETGIRDTVVNRLVGGREKTQLSYQAGQLGAEMKMM